MKTFNSEVHLQTHCKIDTNFSDKAYVQKQFKLINMNNLLMQNQNQSTSSL